MRNTGMSTKLSIIVPIYNVEMYLRECLNSIRNQTYKDFEVLLVDDGSTDGSGVICDKFVEIDSRFRVYHIANSGPSSARNYALTRVSGDWVCFVDSDDCCEKNHFKTLIDNATLFNSDLVMAGYKSLNKKDGLTDLTNYKFQTRSVTPSDAIKVLFSISPWNRSSVSGGYVWSKLFSRKIIENIKFDVSPNVTEDEIFTAFSLFNAENPIVVNENHYVYRQRKSSLSNNSFFNYKILRARLKILKVCQPDSSCYSDILVGVCLAIVQSVSHWHKPEVYPGGEREFIRKINERFLPIAKELTSQGKLDVWTFLIMWLLYFCDSLFQLMLRIYNLCRPFKNKDLSKYFD